MPAHNIILFARWAPNPCDITFVANGGVGEMAIQNVVYGVDEELDSNKFTREGYKFTGWNTKADGSGTAYTDKQIINKLLVHTTLYAQWESTSTDGGAIIPSDKYYEITIIEGPNGDISPEGGTNNKLSVKKGSDQTFTFIPQKGYQVSDVIVNGGSVGPLSQYTFKNIGRDHTIEVRFETLKPGIDNELDKSNHIAYILGTGDGKFEPNRNITRAETVTMVNRALKRSADVEYINENLALLKHFKDVPESYWAYYDILETSNTHKHEIVDSQEQWTGLE